ncbi:hypothetical protein P053_01950 [Brucella abortus 01-4165]|nr:hypothetical protein BAA13334_I00049 [Brucella abortus A13334]AIB20358.1 Hypothetical protein BSPT1_I0249 [Brucella suis bv. 2]AIJ52132.1 hypothetical protein DK48_1855 [Brucella abortus]AIJ92103.1 hypothetical protein DK55_271 [Brucella abortus bv. 2 str. 86/8/59]EHR08734.1 hypothetical protein M1A_02386 [Brucella abortus bv. 1 str. NI486]EHR12538.1 hypothetical protein M17_01295 [Brucella abortus bv. 1 str. NI435a]EHR13744.1 hypothetical protein M19_00552 [Brucella abortus bv. 1 str. NI4
MNTESISIPFWVIRPDFGVWFPISTGKRDYPSPFVFLYRVTEKKRPVPLLAFKSTA